MNALAEVNTDASCALNQLQSRATALRRNIASHSQLASEWFLATSPYTTSISVYETTVKDKYLACCKLQQLSVPVLVYTPTYTECDFKQHSAERCLEIAIQAMKKATANLLVGSADYEHYNASCAKLTAAIPVAMSDMEKKNAVCDLNAFTCELSRYRS